MQINKRSEVNNISRSPISGLLCLISLLATSTVAAQAQTQHLATSNESHNSTNSTSRQLAVTGGTSNNQLPGFSDEVNTFDPNSVKIELDSGFEVITNTTVAEQTTKLVESPEPGTVATSTQVLQTNERAQNSLQAQESESDFSLAQGRSLIRDPYASGAYIGGGVNVGFDDGTPLGEFGGVVFGKIPLGTNISFRPSVVFADGASFQLPLSYDFVIPGETPFAPSPFVPYAGGGAVITTDEEATLGFLFLAGVDYHFSEKFIGNAQLNIGSIEDDTDISIMLGVAYQLFSK